MRNIFIITLVLAFGMILGACSPKQDSQPEKETGTEEDIQTEAAAVEEDVEVAEEESVETEGAEEAAEEESAESDMGKVEIKSIMEFPEPLFQGTPVPVDLPNLEKPHTKRDALMVPEGVENLALGKEISSSDEFPIIGELSMITDGDKEGVEGTYVELGPGKQYAQVDLGQEANIYAIAVWHYHSQARAYHDVIVQISNDAEFAEGVTTVYNNDHDNSAGMGVGEDLAYIETNQGRLIDVDGVAGRYVRLYSGGNTANDMNHYVEVEVYGKPVE